jgi:hypothetical protein
MQMSGQVHAPNALPLRKQTWVYINTVKNTMMSCPRMEFLGRLCCVSRVDYTSAGRNWQKHIVTVTQVEVKLGTLSI